MKMFLFVLFVAVAAFLFGGYKGAKSVLQGIAVAEERGYIAPTEKGCREFTPNHPKCRK